MKRKTPESKTTNQDEDESKPVEQAEQVEQADVDQFQPISKQCPNCGYVVVYDSE